MDHRGRYKEKIRLQTYHGYHAKNHVKIKAFRTRGSKTSRAKVHKRTNLPSKSALLRATANADSTRAEANGRGQKSGERECASGSLAN